MSPRCGSSWFAGRALVSHVTQAGARQGQQRKLEFLGGHLEIGERPLHALIRELAEEEGSGTLSALVAAAGPEPRRIDVVGTPHHLFELEISDAEASGTTPDPKESHAFELVLERDLKTRLLDDELTPRTRQILSSLFADEVASSYEAQRDRVLRDPTCWDPGVDLAIAADELRERPVAAGDTDGG